MPASCTKALILSNSQSSPLALMSRAKERPPLRSCYACIVHMTADPQPKEVRGGTPLASLMPFVSGGGAKEPARSGAAISCR